MNEESRGLDSNARLDWHTGFEGGLRLSLRNYAYYIDIEREHYLSSEPLRIDFLVVRKNADAIIDATKADYTHLVPSKEMLSGFLYGIQAVPATIFVDSSGNQIGDIYFGARSQKDWQKIIDSILAENK